MDYGRVAAHAAEKKKAQKEEEEVKTLALTEDELKEIDEGFRELVELSESLTSKITSLRAKLKKEEKDVKK